VQAEPSEVDRTHSPELIQSPPRAFRFLVGGLGTREGEGGDFLSLVMFVPEYLERLIEQGEKDAAARGDALLDFVDG
jgi:NTE family protein